MKSRSRNRAQLNPQAKALIVAVAVAGAAALAIRLVQMGRWSFQDALVLVGLAAATTITEQFPLQIRHRNENLDVALNDAVWTAGLILARPGVLLAAVAIGVMAGLSLRRVALYKIVFNVGQYVAGLAVAQVALARFGEIAPLESHTWLGTADGMALYAAVSATLVSLVISRASGKSFFAVLLPSLRVSVLHYAGNFAIGILGAIAWSVSPIGLMLLVVPMFLFYVAYRTLVDSMREDERVRHLIVENTSDGIFVTTTDDKILSWNPGMENITGFSADDAIGRNWEELLEAELPTASASGDGDGARSALGRFRPFTKSDGTKGWIYYSSNKVSNRRGRRARKVIVVHDMTAEREAEQVKSDFLSIISHELRTPLTPLKGFLLCLSNGTLDQSDKAMQEYYRIMLNQTARLENLVDELLQASQLDSDEALVHLETMNIGETVARHIEGWADCQGRSRLNLTVPAEAVNVTADPSRFGLVLSNIIGNALKFSPTETPVEIALEVADGEAILAVRDQGEGIPAAEQDKVFERFYQVENPLRRKNGGAGLGLYISKRLMETMDGRLWLHSWPGSGSVFFVSLPLAESDGILGNGSEGSHRTPSWLIR